MKNLQELREFTLCLSTMKGIGPKTFQQLIEHYGDINDIYLNRNEIRVKGTSFKNNKDILQEIVRRNIDYVCVWEETYPSNLKQINDPPIVLFYRGKLSQNIDRSISIVGTRDMTLYGKKYASLFSSELSSKGFAVISGMAFGIDRVAHESCILAGGYTIAVLASSVDEPTPRNNFDLYENIIESGGVILSEMPPGTKMAPGLFPNRNRIIAGLSLGTLVIEAGEKSGSLITANLAYGYSRELFAVPSNIDLPNGYGSNQLIRDTKAKLVLTTYDILSEFGYLNEVDKKVSLEKKYLSLHEESIYNSILSGPKLVEEVASLTNKDIQEVLSLCSILELKGLVSRREDNKIYIS